MKLHVLFEMWLMYKQNQQPGGGEAVNIYILSSADEWRLEFG